MTLNDFIDHYRSTTLIIRVECSITVLNNALGEFGIVPASYKVAPNCKELHYDDKAYDIQFANKDAKEHFIQEFRPNNYCNYDTLREHLSDEYPELFI